MKKQLLTSVIALTLSSAAMANDERKEQAKNEMIGFGSGAALGAVIAGPPGAIVAGIFGLLIADDVNDTEKLAKTNSQLNEREKQLIVLQRQHEQERENYRQQLLSMDEQLERGWADTLANIQFRTASYNLEEHFKPQLNLLAKGLKQNPSLTVDLAGFADRRGGEAYNRALSEQRVITVRNYLQERGVNPKQISATAHGENNPTVAEQSYEGDFFDRRVMLRVSGSDNTVTAATDK